MINRRGCMLFALIGVAVVFLCSLFYILDMGIA